MQVFVNTFGTSIRIQDGLVSIKKEEKIQKIPIGKIDKMFISRGINLSSDVLYNCLENGIDVIITEKNGQPVGRLWNNRFGSISTIRKQQLEFCKSDRVTKWVIHQLSKKVNHQIELLITLKSLDDANHQAIHHHVAIMEQTLKKFETLGNQPIAEAGPVIRAIEGQIAKHYFTCVSDHLPNAFRFPKRSKHPATDMTNALMNYAYGILYGHVESALIKAGLDPFIGFFHRDDYNKPVLTYDVIEVFRPWADWVVFHLCFNEVLDESMFEIENGAYWLKGDSKRILIQHFTDFFEEVVDFEEKRFSRFTHIDRLATVLATKIADVNGGE